MNAATLQDLNGQKFAAGLSTFGRWGQPEDVSDIAAFLASSDSRWITGQLIDAVEDRICKIVERSSYYCGRECF
jgi:3-oxoacyl-[acyl-carrier protein] reductase